VKGVVAPAGSTARSWPSLSRTTPLHGRPLTSTCMPPPLVVTVPDRLVVGATHMRE